MHDHDHDHDGACGTGTAGTDRRRRLLFVVGLAAVYMAAEAIGGWLSGSLALLADAGHMLSDVAALALSLFAVWMASRPASVQRTFGYHRAEILAALANGALLLAVSGGILIEAWHRWQTPSEIDTTTMLVIAVGGLIVNGIMLKVLHGGHQHDLSVRGAWLHVMGDTLGSVGVIAAAVGLKFGQLTWIDPLASAAICVLIVVSAVNLLRETIDILMEAAPATVSVADVRACLLSLPGVRDVHCLHVWRIASGRDSMSAHIVVEDEQWSADQLRRARSALQERFAVGHITLQMEPVGFHACSDQALEHCESRPC
ncbi:MAG: cation transporter [Planctomycetaceae bacterium]|nr:cation transporter [Planctomycetaceae bacterium]